MDRAAAYAASAEAGELGPIVLGQSYRNPALLAKMAATLQTLTRPADHGHRRGLEGRRVPRLRLRLPRPGVRVQQLEEARKDHHPAVDRTGAGHLSRRLLSWSTPGVAPSRTTIPPLLVGGGGTKTMRLAARFADFTERPDANIATYRDRMVGRARPTLRRPGRDPATIRRSWFGRMVLGRDDAEMRRGGQWTRQRVGRHAAQVVDSKNLSPSVSIPS
ncbi:MAG: hypothetical protein R3A10_23205 [Caldilineaceae bacterium]